MNNDIIQGNWKQLTGDIQKKWGKLTDNHLTLVKGSRKKLIGVLQENYGIMREDAEKQVKDWEDVREKRTATLSQKGSK